MKTLKVAVAKYNGISLILRILVGLAVGVVLALVAPGAGWVAEFGNLFVGHTNVIGLIFALAALAGMLYMLFKPYKEATKLSKV